MENKTNLNISLTPLADGTYPDVVVREGTANTIKTKRALNLAVLISAIANYPAGRNYATTPQENPGVVTYSKNKDKAFVKFEENPNDVEATVLTAALKLNPAFTDFAINKDWYFTQKKLETLVRKNANCFPDIDIAKGLIGNLRNFEVKYEQSVKKSDDRAGNKEDVAIQAIKWASGEISGSWNLKMPIFIGTDPVEFAVEIEIEKGAGNMPTFGFYSMALEALVENTAAAVIEDTVAKFQQQFVCLEQD